jgi:membrane-associated protein
MARGSDDRTLAPGAAGNARVPYGKFLVANFVGGAIWVTASVLVGVVAGKTWRVLEQAERWLSLIALAALLGTIAYLWIKRRRAPAH